MPENNEGGKPVVLVVDDEESNILVFKRPLARAGYHVLPAMSGEEAVNLALSREVDVVLLDWMMPHMSGLEVCNRIKGAPKGRLIPVIMVTAKSASTDIKEGLDAGADDYITKPVQMEEALARIRSAVRQRRLEKELHETNEELKRLMAVKDELLNIVSHDMRGPFTSILGYIGVLLGGSPGPLTQMQERIVRIIERAGRRQLKLVNDLLDLANLEAGRDRLTLGDHILGDVLTEMNEMMDYNAKAKNIHFSVSSSCATPVRVDDGKLLRVLNNLVSNAIKFTPPGGSVSVSCVEDNGECRVTVRDTGPGIMPEEMPLLFGKFSKLSTQPTGGEPGSGLGLSIAKNIVERHHGRIWAESEVGKGTSFIFTVPFKPPVS